MTDAQLLTQFAADRSDAAFAEIVRRHVDLVYSTARRLAPHLADDITQAVFLVLAKKAPRLGKDIRVTGWLYTTTCLTARNALREERRRQRREAAAAKRETVWVSGEVWDDIAPRLDDAMGSLGENDRQLILWRFFKNRSHADTAAALGVTENTASRRLSRAVEKLRVMLARKGVVAPTTAITTAVAANAVQAAPAGLAAAVATPTTAALLLSKGMLSMLTLAKLKSAAMMLLGVCLAVSATAFVVLAGENPPVAATTQPASRPTVAWPESVIPPPLPRPVFDRAEFAAMDLPARTALVRQILAWRDSELQNFSFELLEDIANYSTTTGELLTRFNEPLEWSLKRLGPYYLYGGKTWYGTPDQPMRRHWSRWDGVVLRSFVERGTIDAPQAAIWPEAGNSVCNIEFNRLLGFAPAGYYVTRRGMMDAVHVSFPEWLDRFVTSKTPPAIALEPLHGRETIRIDAFNGMHTKVYWLDLERDFMPVLMKSSYKSDFYESHVFQWVSDARSVDGLWCPIETTIVVGQKNDGHYQVRKPRAVRFERNKVRTADLALPYPPDTKVVDVVGFANYTVMADGSAGKVEELYDPASSKARKATPEELAESLAANPINDSVPPAVRTPLVERMIARNEARKHEGDPVWKKVGPEFPEGAKWLNGEPLNLAELRGKLVVLDFFAEWCAPCRNEYPAVVALHERRGQDVVVIGIHTAGSEEAKIRAIMDEYKMSYPICIDTKAGGGFGEFCHAYGVNGIPHAVLLDRSGVVVGRGGIEDVMDTVTELRQQPTTQPAR